MKNILIASDHAGYELKNALLKAAEKIGVTFTDLGTDSVASVDYPDYASKLCNELIKKNKGIQSTEEHLGILICGSGVGVSIQANRFREIRAVLAESAEVAKLGREHNHANVLCLGARIVSEALAIQIIQAYLGATPEKGERHLNRIQKLKGATS